MIKTQLYDLGLRKRRLLCKDSSKVGAFSMWERIWLTNVSSSSSEELLVNLVSVENDAQFFGSATGLGDGVHLGIRIRIRIRMGKGSGPKVRLHSSAAV